MEVCLSNLCTDEKDCRDHGDCQDSRCTCDVGWFGSCCEKRGADEWSELWNLFRIVFAVAFFAVSAFTARQFVKGMMLRRSLGCRIIILRLFKSPRNLSVALIVLATFFRGLWLSIDPFSFNNVLSHLSDRMLYNIVFPLMYSVYCCVLLVWSGLYQGVTNKKDLWSQVYRKSIAAMMCISFCLGISFSACQGLRVTKKNFTVVAFLGICAAVVFILLGLLCFGFLLNKHIKSDRLNDDEDAPPKQQSLRSNPPPPDDSESAELVSSVPTDHPAQLFLQPPRTPVLGQARSKSMLFLSLPVIEPSSSTFSVSSFREPSAWSCNSESEIRSDNISQWSDFDSIMGLPTFHQNPSKAPEKKKAPERENYTVVLTRQDKIIMRQIILLSLMSAVIGVVVVGLTVLVAVYQDARGWRTTLVMMYLISAMEFFAYVSVLFIFATTIKVKSKENLQFISEIATRISRSPGRLVLPLQLYAISKRLHKYACSSEA